MIIHSLSPSRCRFQAAVRLAAASAATKSRTIVSLLSQAGTSLVQPAAQRL
jgi:hypothetical protein